MAMLALGMGVQIHGGTDLTRKLWHITATVECLARPWTNEVSGGTPAMGTEQGPYHNRGVSCAPLGRQGHNGQDHCDDKMTARAFIHGMTTATRECLARPLADKTSSGISTIIEG